MSQSKPDAAAHEPPEVEHLRRRLRALLDAFPGAAAEVDAAGRVVACNRRFAALCGVNEADLTGKPLSAVGLNDAVHLERRPLPPPAEGELVVAESLLPLPGQEREEGDLAGLPDERFRVLCEAAPIGVFLSDAQGRTIYHNPRWLTLTGLTQEEGLGYGWARAVHPDDRVALLDAWRQTIATGDGPWLRRHRLLSASGEVRWVHAWAAPIRGRGGELRGYVGTVEDVTEQVRAEQALRQSEERHRLLVEEFHLGVTVHGPGAEILQVNAAALAMLGLSEDQLLGKTSFDPQWDAIREDGSPLPGPEHPVPQAIRLGRPVHNMAVGVDRPKTRDRVWLLASADPQFDAEGQVRQVVCSFSDITARKSADEERKALERKMQEAQRLESLGVLAGGVAHDFNNLLTGIIGYTSLARQQAPAEGGGRDFLDRALESARRAADLCRQMLAYSGRGRFVVAPLDLSQAVRDQAALLQTSASRKALLSLELADGLPPVLADASQIGQVVLNLALNASEALGERPGSVAVRTGRAWCGLAQLRSVYPEEDVPEGEYVFIEVADTGCGMDAETQRRMFEPFFSTKFLGRGLGLAAVLGIVRGHHGAIELTTEPGLGTTVRVWFPRAPEAPVAAAPEAPAQVGGAVLFVDDEPALRDLAVRTLRPAGYEALTAPNGQEALEVLRGRAADVRAVVLDLTMPGLDADETLRGLHRVRPDLPVILSSGYGEQEAARHFAAGELAGFLQKPYRPHQLLDAIRRAMQGGRGRA